MSNTDANWEKFGKTNPYYGVLTDDKFNNKNLTENINEFLNRVMSIFSH